MHVWSMRIIAALLAVSMTGCATSTATVKHPMQKRVEPQVWGTMQDKPESVEGNKQRYVQWQKPTYVYCDVCAEPTPKKPVFKNVVFKNATQSTAQTNENKAPLATPLLASNNVMSGEPPRPASSETDSNTPPKDSRILIHFDWAKAEISEADSTRIHEYSKDKSDANYSVIGYTDNTQSEQATLGNTELAIRRAEVVKQALIAAGVSEARIATQGRGMCCYVSDNDTEKGRSLNRRVEISITH